MTKKYEKIVRDCVDALWLGDKFEDLAVFYHSEAILHGSLGARKGLKALEIHWKLWKSMVKNVKLKFVCIAENDCDVFVHFELKARKIGNPELLKTDEADRFNNGLDFYCHKDASLEGSDLHDIFITGIDHYQFSGDKVMNHWNYMRI